MVGGKEQGGGKDHKQEKLDLTEGVVKGRMFGEISLDYENRYVETEKGVITGSRVRKGGGSRR